LTRALAAALAVWLAIPAAAQSAAVEAEPGDSSVEVHIGLFDMPDDGEGNPFLDEDLTVVEGIVVFDHQLNEKLGVSTMLTYDFISSASIDRLSKFPDQTGASGDYYIGADLGFDYELSERQSLGWHFGGSVEYDYASIGLGGSYFVEALDRNSSWTYSLEAFFDSIDVIRFDGTEEGTDERTSLAATVSQYRVLGPETHGELGLTLSTQSGFLETAYNAVVLEDPGLPPNPNLANNANGIEITEELPDTRGAIGRARRPALLGHLGRLEPDRGAALLPLALARLAAAPALPLLHADGGRRLRRDLPARERRARRAHPGRRPERVRFEHLRHAPRLGWRGVFLEPEPRLRAAQRRPGPVALRHRLEQEFLR
jgi:hypothetical protein